MAIKDSGERREFEVNGVKTGAVRDIQEGKGRCDLMPLGVVARLTGCLPLADIDLFKKTGDVSCLYEALKDFVYTNPSYSSVYDMLLDLSKHFEEGMKKYGRDNWMKGIPLRSYVDSSVRHILKHIDGWTDERHDRAFCWNLICAIWTKEMMPELDDYSDRVVIEVEKTDGIRCVQFDCYYNTDGFCECKTAFTCPELGEKCPLYMED
ncbi:MAG: hypothetical protein IKU44_04395 [Firmicutes bacterium]|nr:hypothetical protein [Bacillota bacterium]